LARDLGIEASDVGYRILPAAFGVDFVRPHSAITFVRFIFYFLLREPQNNDLGASNGSCPTTVVKSTRRKKSSSTLLGLDGFDQLARKS